MIQHKTILGLAAINLMIMALAGRGTADQASAVDKKYRQSIDTAVDKALVYLVQAQLPNGTYPGGMPKCTAIVSLCNMAYMAKGYTPGASPYGEAINRGIDFVLAAQQPDGTLIGPGGGAMYSHNISTLMLSEASGMVDAGRRKKLQEVLSKALQVIIAAQGITKSEKSKGGWRYKSTSTDSDISHSGWALMALRSAYNNGAGVPKEAVDEAIKYIIKCRNRDGGFGYQPGGGSNIARTGIGLLCLELSGRHRDKLALVSANYINTKFKAGWKGEYFFYAIYYTSQAMFQLNGEQWESFAPFLNDTVLKLQAADGSWPMAPGGSGSEKRPGPCYRPAMAVLALSVAYRQLPIYQR